MKKEWVHYNPIYLKSVIIEEYKTIANFLKEYEIKRSTFYLWQKDGMMPLNKCTSLIKSLHLDVNKFLVPDPKEELLWEK